MNLFDIIVAATGISSAILGLHKGLIRLSIGLICFFLSLISAYFIFPMVASAVAEHLKNEIAINVASGVVGYLVSMLFFAFVGSQLGKAVDGISGGLIDRILGFGAGVVRALIICSIIFGAIAIFTSDAYVNAKTASDISSKIDSSKYPKWLTESKSYSIIENSAKILCGMISEKQLKEIKLPQSSKNLPDIPVDALHEATKAGVEHILRQQVNTLDSSASNAEPKDHHFSDKDELDSELNEMFKD